jgi:dephospho-CoA kinase
MSVLFAFSGPIGSGKSNVSKLFAERIGAKRNSFGGTVREIATERGLPVGRTDLQALGAILVASERDGFCRRVVAVALNDVLSTVVIDGLRHVEILAELKRIVDPRIVRCVYVDAPLSIRLERVRLRDGLSQSELVELQRHSTEVEVEQHLRAKSDYIADNSQTVGDCVERVIEWARGQR